MAPVLRIESSPIAAPSSSLERRDKKRGAASRGGGDECVFIGAVRGVSFEQRARRFVAPHADGKTVRVAQAHPAATPNGSADDEADRIDGIAEPDRKES